MFQKWNKDMAGEISNYFVSVSHVYYSYRLSSGEALESFEYPEIMAPPPASPAHLLDDGALPMVHRELRRLLGLVPGRYMELDPAGTEDL